METFDIEKIKADLNKHKLKKQPVLKEQSDPDELKQRIAEFDEKWRKKKRDKAKAQDNRKTKELELLEETMNIFLDSIGKGKKKEEKVVEVIQEEKEWDVPIGEEITYFDPTLSYELTGYRPITDTQGLDFDPDVFTQAAKAYKKNGRYTDLIPGTFAHRLHWQEEFNRCRDGYTVGRYRLTGENYFWLNYYRIPSVLDKSGAELQEESFPTFIAKQYEYFHYLELCRKAGFDGMAFKSRGVK